jgi:CubicO group peptidase (beta-lactamase class C family)
MNLNKFADKADKQRILGLIISQNGEIIAKQNWDDDIRRNIYSASKSFTSCAMGFAIKEGLINLDEKIIDVFANDISNHIEDNLSKVKVRDLLTMCLGQERAFLMGAERLNYKEDDWVKLSLSIPFIHEPGTQFLYSNTGPYLAGVLIQRRAGCDLVSYLTPRLFQPLGIKRPTWESDPLGNTFGASGLLLSISELHKLGLLYLQKGKWNGRELLPESWINECTTNQVGNLSPHGYGYLFWRNEIGAYMAFGKYEQYTIIFYDKNAVITTTAECKENGSVLKTIIEEIYPQL